jgi:hypothetical protein
MWCIVPDIGNSCCGLKIKRFENRAVHVYRAATRGKLDPVDTATTGLFNNRNYTLIK